jgi:hypothetical protein
MSGLTKSQIAFVLYVTSRVFALNLFIYLQKKTESCIELKRESLFTLRPSLRL